MKTLHIRINVSVSREQYDWGDARKEAEIHLVIPDVSIHAIAYGDLVRSLTEETANALELWETSEEDNNE